MIKILLIAGNTQNDLSLKKGLTLYGHRIITTSQRDDWLALASNELPDLILINMETAGLNGWQTIQRLRASRATWMIPAIAIGHPLIEGDLLIQAGFDSYCRQPVSLKYLLMKIDVLVNTDAIAPKQKDTSAVTPSILGARSAETLCPAKAIGQTMVVYVEDSSKDSQTMAQIIENAGYSYANISDSLQALPQLLEYKPQLIFLDLVMPMANGYELCAQIRRISAFRKTPIVIVTNNDGVIDRVRAKVVGASDFVSKPIGEQRILRVIRKYLNPFQSIPDNSDNLRSRLLKKLILFKSGDRFHQNLDK
ncbi:MAG: response regulator [Cyanobacteria bacterium P01_B01_bin.77]